MQSEVEESRLLRNRDVEMTFRFLFQADVFRILNDPDDFNVWRRVGVGPEFFSNRVAVAKEIARHRLVDDPDVPAPEVVVFVKIAARHNRCLLYTSPSP